MNTTFDSSLLKNSWPNTQFCSRDLQYQLLVYAQTIDSNKHRNHGLDQNPCSWPKIIELKGAALILLAGHFANAILPSAYVWYQWRNAITT